MAQDDAARCFVLMPFDEAFEPIYERLIKTPLEGLGFEVTRADSLFNQRNILQDVIEGIAAADYIVADLTGLNPNVFYELGMAHALGKRTVIITQDISTLPFDLRSYRANGYSTFFTEAEELSTLITDVGKGVLEETAEFSNPVQDFAPQALGQEAQVARSRPRGKTAPAANDDSEPTDDEGEQPGFLETALAVELTAQDVVRAAKVLSELTQGIGTSFEKHTQRLERAQKNLGNRSTGALLAIARDAARDLDKYAAQMEEPVQGLKTALDGSTAGANWIAKEAHIESDADIEGATSLMNSLSSVEQQMLTVYDQVTGFAGVIAEIPDMDRKLTASARRASAIVLETADAIERAAADFSRARGVVESRLDATRS